MTSPVSSFCLAQPAWSRATTGQWPAKPPRQRRPQRLILSKTYDASLSTSSRVVCRHLSNSLADHRKYNAKLDGPITRVYEPNCHISNLRKIHLKNSRPSNSLLKSNRLLCQPDLSHEV